MKKLYIIFLFSILSLYVNAQDNLDSLWNVWNNESQADTTRLEAIHVFLHGGKDREFSRSEALSQDLDSAFSLCEQMSNLAKSGGHKKYLVYSLRIKGGYLKLVNDSEQRIELFEQALEIASELKDERLIILSSMTLGYGFLDTNDLILAEENFRIALSLIELETFISEGSTSKIDPELSSYAGMAFMGLARVMEAQRNYEQSTEYLQQAVLLAGQSNMVSMLEESMGRLGAAFEREKKYLKAIKFFSKSLKLAEQKGDKHWIAHNLGSLGHLYTQVGEYTKAQDYLFHALTSMQEAGPIHSSEQLNIVELLAMNYREQKNYSKALEYDSIMLKLAEEFNPAYFPIAMIHFAMDFYELGDYTNALEHGFRTLEMNEEYVSRASNFIRNSVFILIGKTYGKQGQFAKAITWCEKTDKDLPIEYEKEICECLYEAHKGLKHGNEALAYHERFLVLSDSLNTEELAKNLQQMEFREQVLVDSLATVEEKRLVEEAHQEEVLAKEKQRNIFMGSGLLVLLLSGGLWSRLRFIRKSKATLQVEKDRSENLLLNILPAEVAEELKDNGKAQARDFEMVSILFTDFKEFTQTSEKLSAAELVGEINHCFEGFDAIMEKHGVEKIKTIGDAYMAAGGLPVSTPESPMYTVQAALEMCEFVANRKIEREAEGKIGFEMRCGIHTGPVVAGIVGVKKFQYDIWGDTVNTASRMESNSEVGKVNISQDTYELIKNESAFSFEKRSKIEVKGKGEMDMYFVS